MTKGLGIVSLVWLLVISSANSYSADQRQLSYSPSVDNHYPNNVYWGDTHVHTKLSVDSDLTGGNKLIGPEEAYLFAKGGAVTAHNGMQAKLSRPLDFVVLADHAENLGLMTGIRLANPLLLNTPEGRKLYEYWNRWGVVSREKKMRQFSFSNWYAQYGVSKPAISDDAYFNSVWQSVAISADKHNDPGKFTAFIGYEWTSFKSTDSTSDNFSNLHRVVIFADGADKAGQILPFSAFDSSDPEDLWQFLDSYQEKTGGDALAIPHNGNLSRGDMFSLVGVEGQPLTKLYAKTRSRWEPLYEVTQTKGDGETHPALSPNDEFADYERLFADQLMKRENTSSDGADLYQYEYARSALKLGLDQAEKLGVNPFKFGMIGSTDTHTGLATADENNFWGKVAGNEPNATRLSSINSISASGYTAVWAEENTREALFSGMKRKEVYASTGPRITVRFFGGWDFKAGDELSPDLASIGYSRGVPMGGDLTNAPKKRPPNFLISAVKDPEGANLDRIQVIKGWRDKRGGLHEKVYNVALSDGRKEDGTGYIPPVGSTVDLAGASYTNSIGDSELAVVWTDPEFNKDELAFYYVRVLEIPTPRWTAYDVKFFNLKVPVNNEMLTQERIYTSPIWYSPVARIDSGVEDLKSTQ